MTADNTANTPPTPRKQPSAREITDAKTMRAMAHPIRLELLELIRRDGEVTATRAAEALGDSPGNMSWHLQTLARYGFIEEAEGGKGRSRPWRIASGVSRISTADGDQGAVAASNALAGLVVDRSVERLRAWLAAAGEAPKEWKTAAPMISSLMYMTAAELQQVSDELVEILSRFDDRVDPEQRPDGALPVQLTAFGYPVPPTSSGN